MTTLTITGTAADDTIVITASATDSGAYSINGGPAVAFSGVTQVVVTGEDGNDTLTIVNPDGGLFAPTNGIDYDGGNQPADGLEVLGGTANDLTYIAGATPDAGTLTYTAEAGTQTIDFAGIAPITDTVVAATLTITGSAGADAITVTDGGLVNGFQTTQVSAATFESIRFANKTLGHDYRQRRRRYPRFQQSDHCHRIDHAQCRQRRRGHPDRRGELHQFEPQHHRAGVTDRQQRRDQPRGCGLRGQQCLLVQRCRRHYTHLRGRRERHLDQQWFHQHHDREWPRRRRQHGGRRRRERRHRLRTVVGRLQRRYRFRRAIGCERQRDRPGRRDTRRRPHRSDDRRNGERRRRGRRIKRIQYWDAHRPRRRRCCQYARPDRRRA